jgi:beta-fructofuranosidase
MTSLPDRPEFHFTAANGWINDPYGLAYRNGVYHLFFQYVPDSLTWAPNVHWGHATSVDMVSWIEQPHAIAPGEDDDGIWSGSIAVDDNGSASLFYTSIKLPDANRGRVRLATPLDEDWREWSKGDILVQVPDELDVVAFRDPFVFRDANRWRMLVGTGLTGGIAAASSFSSNDLRTWRFDGIAAHRSGAERQPVWTGTLWECPQIFAIDGRHVLVTSVWENDVLHYVAYGVGSYQDGTFRADSWGQLTYGTSYYAPSFYRDRDGRPGLIYWMRGLLDTTAGRAGALSVPHLLHLEGDQLSSTPHPDLWRYATPCDGARRLSSTNAYLITWSAASSNEQLTLTKDQETVVRLEKEPNRTLVISEQDEVALPVTTGLITIVVDGPCIEICTSAGNVGLGQVVQPWQQLRIAGGAFECSVLSR